MKLPAPRGEGEGEKRPLPAYLLIVQSKSRYRHLIMHNNSIFNFVNPTEGMFRDAGGLATDHVRGPCRMDSADKNGQCRQCMDNCMV